MTKKQKYNTEDNRGVAIYARKSRITNKGDSIGVQFKHVQNTPNENCISMKITLSSNMRTRDFPAITPTVPIFNVCSTILKWAKFVPLFVTN